MTLFALQFDATIHLGDLIAYGGVLGIAWRMFMYFRDEQRDIRRIVGRDDTEPHTGLVAKVKTLDGTVQEHREWLVIAGLDRRSGHERRYVGYGRDMREEHK